jgi:hypothetical protein
MREKVASNFKCLRKEITQVIKASTLLQHSIRHQMELMFLLFYILRMSIQEITQDSEMDLEALQFDATGHRDRGIRVYMGYSSYSPTTLFVDKQPHSRAEDAVISRDSKSNAI